MTINDVEIQSRDRIDDEIIIDYTDPESDKE